MKKTLHTLFTICLSTSAILYPLDNLFSFITSADTYNERHTQSQLNTLIRAEPTSALGISFESISALPLSEQRSILNEFSGEQYANVIKINQVGSQQFMRRMYEPVRYESLGLQCGQNCDQIEFWSAIGGGEAYQSKSHGAKGFRLGDFNVAFGAQKPLNFNFLNSWLTVGVAGFYENDEIRFSQRGRATGNNWQGGFYYMWNNCHFYSFQPRSQVLIASDLNVILDLMISVE